MTKEELEMYYDLLGFKYEAAIGALYARDLVDDEWVRQSRKRFFDKLERERELHFRRVSDYEALCIQREKPDSDCKEVKNTELPC